MDIKRWVIGWAFLLGGCSGLVETTGKDATDGAPAVDLHATSDLRGQDFASVPAGDGGAVEVNDLAAPPSDLLVPATLCPAAGSYCGGHGVDGDPGTLYLCGAAMMPPGSSMPCANGCDPKGGGADACKVGMPMMGGPVCPDKGAFCGGDGVSAGDANTLYQCPGKGLAPSSSMACGNGCQIEPNPNPDFCKGALVCPTAGDYCGGDQLGGDPNTLYHCGAKGQAPSSSKGCQMGCQVNQQGVDDVCKGGLACPGPGDYCGADGVQGGDANTLYHCPGAGQAPTGSQPCANGCTIQPQGVQDFCAQKLTCPSAGDYCGNDGVGGPANILYHCMAKGQAPASSDSCAAGCIVMKQGVNDLCGAAGCSGLSQAALNWEANQLNTGHPWSSLCLGFVNNAYAAAGNSPGYLHLASANDSLNAARGTGRFVAWNGSCPCGGILYWSANNCNGEWGHVVICNGDGSASTSGWKGFGGATHASINWLDGQECGHTPAGYIVP